MVTFYSKFVLNLATIAAPIYQLTRKNVPFDWNEECQKAFQTLKQELISNRFLTYFNPKLPLIVSCDASPVGLGAVLAHKLPSGEEKPIAYASRTLSNSERNYSQIDKESLAIIFAVKHFHFFLYGKDRFTIYTDHKPLISLFGEHAKLPTLVAARLKRWALTLSAYNYKIEYRTGANNGNADALSRKPLVQTRDAKKHVFFKPCFLCEKEKCFFHKKQFFIVFFFVFFSITGRFLINYSAIRVYL